MSRPNPIRELYQLADKHNVPHDEVKAWVERWVTIVCSLSILSKEQLESSDAERLRALTVASLEKKVSKQFLALSGHLVMGQIAADDRSGLTGAEDIQISAVTFRNSPKESK